MDYTKRDKQIIRMREKRQTYKQIGDYFNLTRERVRQILVKYGKDGLRKDIPTH